ncbi:16702_t:CDS:2 [Dentiscutata erythropus]|uniref:16702_t:CDS:1 n=1 Tax=Dentiscutata erythropus TaxID=1348616 RepID=A0A9N9JK84_9GLOM|nr:16702_t:CDS:2 [Dentiscutata erythropus]
MVMFGIQDKENKNINFVKSLAMNTDSISSKDFFIASQLDKSNRFTAKKMVNELQEIAKSSKIFENDNISTEQEIKS